MKAPIVAELTGNPQSDDKDIESNKEVETIVVVNENERPKGKSYTLYPHHLRYINKEAIKLATERGVTVNASEALRVILDRVMECEE